MAANNPKLTTPVQPKRARPKRRPVPQEALTAEDMCLAMFGPLSLAQEALTAEDMCLAMFGPPPPLDRKLTQNGMVKAVSFSRPLDLNRSDTAPVFMPISRSTSCFVGGGHDSAFAVASHIVATAGDDEAAFDTTPSHACNQRMCMIGGPASKQTFQPERRVTQSTALQVMEEARLEAFCLQGSHTHTLCVTDSKSGAPTRVPPNSHVDINTEGSACVVVLWCREWMC